VGSGDRDHAFDDHEGEFRRAAELLNAELHRP
jgi:hypothetical protein